MLPAIMPVRFKNGLNQVSFKSGFWNNVKLF